MIVVHHPASHPYVDHASPGGHADLSVWDLDELSAAGASIVHLHFGFEQRTERELHGWADGLAARRIPLVLTVHDLDNPHLTDQRSYHRLLDLLIGQADAVITLTSWAAAEIHRRHGRTVRVIPHPHVIPLGELRRRRDASSACRDPDGIYVHAATCRPNLDVDLLAALAPAARPWGGLRVHVRAPLTSRARAVVDRCAGRSGLRLDRRRRLADHELWDRLQRATAVLLPYRWGTHSGLLEAARDLGTPVVAPPVGAYLDQGAVPLEPGDPFAGLSLAERPQLDTIVTERLRQRAEVERAHRAVYDEVLGTR